MTIKLAKLLSGRVPVTGPTGVTADRYQFLGVNQAEPNLGFSANGNVLTTNIYGTRIWSNVLNISSITLTGNLSTTANVIAGYVRTDHYQWANGAPFVSSSFGNTELSAYLLNNDITIGGNLTVLGNVTILNTEVVNTTEYVNTLKATTVNAATIGNIGANLVGSGAYITGVVASAVSTSYTVATANVSVHQQLTSSTTNQAHYLPFYRLLNGNASAYTNTALTYNPNNGTLVAGTFSGIGALSSLTTTGVSTLGGNVVLISGTPTNDNNTGALVLTGTGGAAIGGNLNINGQLFIGADSQSAGLVNATLVARGSSQSGSGLQYTQFALFNTTSSGSTDFAAYPNNLSSDQAHGWVDMGITGDAFNDPAYTITKPNDSYLFGSGANATVGGNLVLATDYSGSYNDIVVATGGFTDSSEVARFHGNAATGGYLVLKQGTAATSTTTGALRVQGGVGVTGNIYAGNVITTGNIVGGGVRSTTSATAPTTPTVGDMWYNTANDILYRYTFDGTSNNWLDIISAPSSFGNLSANSGIASTSTTTGTFVVWGGAGVTGNVNAGAFYSDNYLFANGVSIISAGSSSYGNTQVAAYLPLDPTIYGIQANLGAYENTTNANLGTATNNINSINANIGAYETFANTAIASLYTNANANTAAYLNKNNITVGANLTVTGNLIVVGNSYVLNTEILTQNEVISGNVYAGAYFWANGTPFASSSYGNTEVSAYLKTATGNISAGNITVANNITATGNVTAAYFVGAFAGTGTGGTITGANVIAANTFAFNSNGINILDGVNASIYTLQANVGAYEIYANANLGTAFNSINSINANLGTYENTTNANIGTIYNSVNSINANLGAYQTYANANAAVQAVAINSLYLNANANTAAYLLTATGNVSAGNVVAAGNVTAQNFIGNLYGTATGGSITGANLLSTAYLTVTANATIANVLVSNGIFWANGLAWSSSSGSTSTFGNANLATLGGNNVVTTGNVNAGNVNVTSNVYAQNFIGNLYGTATGGSITNANLISSAYLTATSNVQTATLNVTANAYVGNVITNNFYYANGQVISLGGNYGNTQVAAYLPIDPTIYGIQANLGAYEIYANANLGTAFNSINSINANLGSYENTTNANIGTVFTRLNTLDANVGAFETYANANAASQATAINSLYTNANANTAAYLTSTAINLGTITQPVNVLGNLYVAGNLSIGGNAFTLSSTDLIIQDSIIQLHTQANLAPWTVNDGKDIGLALHYYDTADRLAFLGRDNGTGYFEFIADGTESVANTFTGTYATIKSGELILSNTTASTSNVTGALRVSGGVGITGDMYAQGNIYSVGNRVLTTYDLQTITYAPVYFTMTPGAVTVPVVGTSTTYGDYKFGDVTSVQIYGDYNTTANTGFISVYDVTGAPGHIEYFGFTGIADFSRVVMNVNYTANSGHTQDIDLYNYQTDSWDTFGTYSGSGNWQQFALGVIDSAPYISGGNVTLRNYHLSSGNTTHRTWIDYVAVEQTITGGQGPRGATGSTGATGATGPSWQGGYTANATVFGSNLIANSGATSGNVSTGAFVVVGGAGISGNLNVGGNLVANGVDLVANAAAQAVAINSLYTNANANTAAYLTTYTGNISAGNVVATGNVTAQNFIGNLYGGTSGGSITNANLLSASYITATSNVQAGTLNVTANAYIGNVLASQYLYANGVSILTGIGGTYSNTNVAAYLLGSITTGALISTGNITAGNLIANANVYAQNFIGNLYGGSSGGSITNANLLSASYVTATSNVQAATLNVTANAYVGNVISNSFFYANGQVINFGGTYGNTQVAAYLASNAISTVYTLGNIVSNSNIISNTAIIAPNYLFANGVNILSTITAGSTYSNTNVAAFLGNTSTTGNIYAGNVVATGNVTAQNFIGNLYGQGSGGFITGANLLSAQYLTATANVTTANINVSANAYIGNVLSNQYLFANGVNILSTITVPSTYSNANVVANLQNFVTTISTTANIITTANVISPNYLFANGVNILSTITAGSTYSNANVIANLQNLTTNIVTTANVTANNFIGNLYGSGSGGFITGANLLSAGYLTATSNVQTVNLNVSANAYVGNVIATGFYFANGTPFVSGSGGSTSTYSNVNVAAYLSSNTVSNIYTTGNIISSGNIVATGNVTAAYFVGAFAGTGTGGTITGANIIAANTFAFNGNGVNILDAVTTPLYELQANVGAYEIYANANAVAQATAINSLYTNANANTAAYLLSGTPITVGGNLTVSGNLIVAGNSYVLNTEILTQNEVVAGNVYAANYYFSNGTPYSYGNVQVGQYLPIYEGNVAYANVSYYTTPVPTSSSATFYPEFASSTSGNTRAYVNNSLTYVPSSGTLTATTFSGAGTFTTLSASSTTTLSGILTLNSGVATNDNSTGALVITGAGGLAVAGNVNLLNQLFVGTGSQATSLVNPVTIMRGTSTSGAGSQYTQSALINATDTGSSDFIAYGDNYLGTTSDHGWMDVGYTGSTFNDAAYTITGANDGYIFAGAVNNTLGGNLVLATDNIGNYKDIVIGVGGFLSDAEVARFHGNAATGGYFALKQGTAATSTTTGALRVTGGAGITGNLWAGNILATNFFYANGTAFVGGGGGTSFTGGQVTSGIYANGNLTLDLGTTSAYWRTTYTGNIVTTGGVFWSNGVAYSSGGGGGGGSAAGTNLSLQYNNGGSFDGTNFLYFTGNGTIATATGNIEAGGARSTTGSTPPANPTVGDVWYNSTTDVTFRYQFDGTNKYWVDIGGPAVVSTAVGTPQGRSIAFSLIFGG